MQLSPHLTLEEFTASDTAERMKINNNLPADMMPSAMRTAAMLEAIRARLSSLAGHDVPIIVTSGYRCSTLNRVIGSTPGSDHPRATAIDFRAPAFGTPRQVCQALAPYISTMDIGQLIYELSWVHASWRRPMLDSNRVLTLNGNGYIQGIA